MPIRYRPSPLFFFLAKTLINCMCRFAIIVQTKHFANIGVYRLQVSLLGTGILVCFVLGIFRCIQAVLFFFQGLHTRQLLTAGHLSESITGSFVQRNFCTVLFVKFLGFFALAVFGVNVLVCKELTCQSYQATRPTFKYFWMLHMLLRTCKNTDLTPLEKFKWMTYGATGYKMLLSYEQFCSKMD